MIFQVIHRGERERERGTVLLQYSFIYKTALLKYESCPLANFEGLRYLLYGILNYFWTVAFQKGCTHEQMAKCFLSHHQHTEDYYQKKFFDRFDDSSLIDERKFPRMHFHPSSLTVGTWPFSLSPASSLTWWL